MFLAVQIFVTYTNINIIAYFNYKTKKKIYRSNNE